ncbi:MAG TPA: hypothetical protein DIW52_28300 [Pseudomonas sp.]|nr:hypothetical protein [Pseudomonas sp.]
MNRTDLPFRKDYLRTIISKSETIENLWTTCLKITKEMGFDYFSYSIQHPTPFTNHKTYIYGNYPFETSRLLNR